MLAAGRCGLGALAHGLIERRTPADQWPGIRPAP